MLAIAALILLAMAGMFFRDWAQYRGASADEEHTRGILDSTQRLFSTVQDAETGQRGYLLTGEEKYLAPYYLAIQLASGEMANLKSLLTRPGDQPQDASRLSALLDQKLAELHKTIELRRSHGLEAALAVVLTGRGKQLMDQIRELCTGIQKREYSALIDASRHEKTYARQTELVMIAGSLILFAFLIAASVMTNRAVLAREQSLGETREAHDMLQTTLTSIGDAVIATDAQGRIEFANPTARALLRTGEAHLGGLPLDDVFRIVNDILARLSKAAFGRSCGKARWWGSRTTLFSSRKMGPKSRLMTAALRFVEWTEKFAARCWCSGTSPSASRSKRPLACWPT